nr:hypothetical protein B0A51_07397 [Rachicladosporium sp. CCFEE 5018]
MDGSPLGTIPPEIRVMIFDNVLSEVIVDVGLNSRNPPGQTAYSQHARFTAITRVCRKIRRETSDLHPQPTHATLRVYKRSDGFLTGLDRSQDYVLHMGNHEGDLIPLNAERWLYNNKISESQMRRVAVDIGSIRVDANRCKNPSLAMAYAMMMADKLASIVKWSLGVDSHVLIGFGKDNKSRSIPLKIRLSPLLVSIERKATFATFERSINMEFKAMRAARAALDFNEHKQAGERQRLRDVLDCVRHLFHSGDVVSSPVIGRSVMGLEAAKCRMLESLGRASTDEECR